MILAYFTFGIILSASLSLSIGWPESFREWIDFAFFVTCWPAIIAWFAVDFIWNRGE